MKRFLCGLTAAALLLSSLAGCAADTPGGPDAAESTPALQTQPQESASAQPAQSPSASPVPTPSPRPTPEPYRFGQPVEEREAVDEDWFADAVFLGDSRTEGLQLFSGLRAGDFFWYKGMTVFKVDDPKYRKVEIDGESYTILEALALKQYAKVYIMIGINELGYAASSYQEGLAELIRRVKEIQPDAVVYLQTLPPVNETVAAQKKLGSYINNKNVNAFNRAIWEVAWAEQAALLDVASVFRSERGDLPADLAADGVHFYRKGYAAWYEYLKTHTLTPEEYAGGVPQDEKPEPSFPPLLPEESVPPAETDEPSAAPAPTETPEPSAAPEPKPTPAPTPAPTPEPTPTPEPAPTPEPEETPAPEPAPTPTPTPEPVESAGPEPGNQPGPLVPEPTPGMLGG